MPRYTCGELIAEYLVRFEIPIITGIIGHGCLCLAEAFIDYQDKIKVIQAKHEQNAVHLADGYARATGKPLAVFTSVGPGAYNTLMGMATAYADSVPMLVFTGAGQTYFFGKGPFQAVERRHRPDFTNVTQFMTKKSWLISNIEQLPDILPAAYRIATTGRPGPVHIDLPMDIQAQSVDVELMGENNFRINTRVGPDRETLGKVAKELIASKRPVLLAGGGALMSEASDELTCLAEYLGIPVVTSFGGKGAISEKHPLCAFYTGFKGSPCGTEMCKKADVFLALGYRFAEWSSSSYVQGVSFNIPPSRVIQVDLDPQEIGRAYPIEMGITSDIKTFLRSLLDVVRELTERREYEKTEYFAELQQLKGEWQKALDTLATDELPMSTSRFLKELREFMPDDGIVVGGAGYTQMQILHEFPVYYPRTCITSTSFAPMGLTLPAAIGAQLAYPDRMVVAVFGDGDYLMCLKELATAVQLKLPIICAVLNNYGHLSIRDLLINHLDRHFATEFTDEETGEPYTPDYVTISKAFGAYSERVEKLEDIQPALERARQSGKTAVVEFMTAREFGRSGGVSFGIADTPSQKKPSQRKSCVVREG
jgi:acetolactate synthase-1/2/3 large subunit